MLWNFHGKVVYCSAAVALVFSRRPSRGSAAADFLAARID